MEELRADNPTERKTTARAPESTADGGSLTSRGKWGRGLGERVCGDVGYGECLVTEPERLSVADPKHHGTSQGNTGHDQMGICPEIQAGVG